jgi:protein-tyrosine-phosphatase
MSVTAEEVARKFHETYESLAPEHGYKTREASAKPWSEVPQQNKDLMIAVVQALLDSRVIATTGGGI